MTGKRQLTTMACSGKLNSTWVPCQVVLLVRLQAVCPRRAVQVLCQASGAPCSASTRQLLWICFIVKNGKALVEGVAPPARQDNVVHDRGPIFKLTSSAHKEGCKAGVWSWCAQMAHQTQNVVLRLNGRHWDLLAWKRYLNVLAINWIQFVTLKCSTTACLALRLCHKLTANMWRVFFSETIHDLTFGAGVSDISSADTPGSAPGKSTLWF